VEVEPRCECVEVSEGEDREKRVRLGGCFQVNGAEEKLFLGGGQPPKEASRRPQCARPARSGCSIPPFLAFRAPLLLALEEYIIPFLKTQLLNHEGRAFKA
jgi:hypothetical protein